MNKPTKKIDYPTYRDRNELLLKMGYKSYQEYLVSDVWSAIRDAVYRLKGKRCYICTRDADILHHKGYGFDTLVGTNLDPIVPLCNSCHLKVEFRPNGEKRSLRKVEVAFNALVQSKNHKIKKHKPEIRRCFPKMCANCGGKAKKNREYCRSCAKRLNKTVKVIEVCTICKGSPKLDDNRWCTVCVEKFIRRGRVGMGPSKIKPGTKKYMKKFERFKQQYGNNPLAAVPKVIEVNNDGAG